MAEYVFTQNNNEVKVQFLEDGVAKDLSSVTKIVLQLFSSKGDPINRVAPVKSFDSLVDAAIFDITGLGTGDLVFKPVAADLTTLTEPQYYGRFIIFSGTYPSGLVWAVGPDALFKFTVAL